MVSVSCLEVVLGEANICFSGVVVFTGDCGLVDDGRLETVAVEWTGVFLSAVACLAVVGPACVVVVI